MNLTYCRTLFALILLVLVNIVSATEIDVSYNDSTIEERYCAPLLFEEDTTIEEHSITIDQVDTVYVPKKRKLKAVLLSVFLGHFGVHRIYLGTKANVPVAYSLTLGGGLGLLPFIDTIMILQSKDLDEFSNNDKVIMWSKQKTTQP